MKTTLNMKTTPNLKVTPKDKTTPKMILNTKRKELGKKSIDMNELSYPRTSPLPSPHLRPPSLLNTYCSSMETTGTRMTRINTNNHLSLTGVYQLFIYLYPYPIYPLSIYISTMFIEDLNKINYTYMFFPIHLVFQILITELQKTEVNDWVSITQRKLEEYWKLSQSVLNYLVLTYIASLGFANM